MLKTQVRQSVPKDINDTLLTLIAKKINLQESITSPNFISMLQKKFDQMPQSQKRFFWTTIDTQLKTQFPNYRFTRNWSSKRFSTICQKNFDDLSKEIKQLIIDRIVSDEISSLPQLNQLLRQIETDNPTIASKKIQSYGRQRYNKYISVKHKCEEKEQLKQLLATKTFSKLTYQLQLLPNSSNDTQSINTQKEIVETPSQQHFQLENISNQQSILDDDIQLLQKISQIIINAQQ